MARPELSLRCIKYGSSVSFWQLLMIVEGVVMVFEKCGEDYVDGDMCRVGSMMGSGECFVNEEMGYEIEDKGKKMKVVRVVKLEF